MGQSLFSDQVRPFTAPKRFVFKDPDTGQEFHEKTEADLLNRIVAYRSQNELETIEELRLVLHAYWCSLPENAGNCRSVPLTRGIMQYLKGGFTLFKNSYFKKFVSQEQADARARICVKCPHNVFPDKGSFMTWTDSVAEASIGERRTALHDSLGNCGVCSCVLKAKVWNGERMTPTPLELTQLPDFCWQRKG